jgi:ribosome-binding ATPase YchF (GTP1/OBG family)
VIRIGLIGKTNTGKTTFFNSATLGNEEIANYPFTTKKPIHGNAHVITLCVHKEFGLVDNPRNSLCKEGWRFIPVELIDLPGLIKGAWEGIDSSGKIAEAGAGDPIADVSDIEEELVLWYLKLFEGNREKISRMTNTGLDTARAVTEIFGGIGVKEWHVKKSISENNIADKNIHELDSDETRRFISTLREISKPSLIVANKIDLHPAAENFKRLREHNKHMFVIPSSADAELTLRRAQNRGLIKYSPGDEIFDIYENTVLNEKQKWALNFIRKDVLGEYLRTGVQFALNIAVFKLLNMNVVYPVSDPNRLSDKKGNVLPDAFLMKNGSTVQDLASDIHTELSKGIVYAVDVRNGLRLPGEYQIKDRDVLSIVSTMIKK